MKMNKAKNIDEFIATYPVDIQATLQQLQTTIKKLRLRLARK